MNFIANIFKGILIGAGAILPGISSGVLCVVFGIYEKLLNSILNFFKDIKNNFKFLFPIAFGGFIGVLIFSKLLNFLLFAFPMQTKSIFIGLIVGCIPSLIKDINRRQIFKFRYIFYLLLALFLGIITVFLEKSALISITSNVSFLYLVCCGFLMSIGIVVPGVSSTIILMLLGVYSIYLDAVSSLYFPVLIPIIIGLVFGCFIFMILTRFLLKNFYPETFYSIIGFTLGSILVLLPSVNSLLDIFICLFGFMFGFFIVYN